jgi:hypothetical protein
MERPKEQRFGANAAPGPFIRAALNPIPKKDDE